MRRTTRLTEKQMGKDLQADTTIPIRDILNVFAKAVRSAIRDPGPLPAIIKNPLNLVNRIKNSEKRRRANSSVYKIPIPRFCIFSVTWKCSLECAGCYAGSYASEGSLDKKEIERIIREVSDLGTYIFLIAGGEPFEVKDIISVLAGVPRSLFFIFTNGTLLIDDHLKQLACSTNILPVFSVDGDDVMNDERRGCGTAEKIRESMRRLRAAGVAFGFSTMVTHRNLHYVTSRDWMGKMWDCGARFGFLIDYIPFNPGLDPGMVLTDEDRAFKSKAVIERKSEARPFVVNFPPDEYEGSGCLSGGNGFVHINADGFVEPCPFCHYASENIKEKPFRAILGSPFLSSIRETFGKNRGFSGTCMLFQNAGLVETIASSTGAKKTDGKRVREPVP